MRLDPPAFAVANRAPAKQPRFVIAIQFDVESIYMTSHAGITAVPGVVMQNVLRVPSAVSQKIVPDEGRSEIGSFTFSLVDVDSVFTEEIREKLDDGKGLRGKRVRFYAGHSRYAPRISGGFGEGGFGDNGFGNGEALEFIEATFPEFVLFQTQIITGVSFDQGLYEVSCADITREQRTDVFEQKVTTLRETLAVGATTVSVYTTAGFQPVYHGSSYSDAPDQTVGYLKIDDEWIRYPFAGLTVDSFVGCTRGVLNTREVEHKVDPNSEADRRPKVEEGIYLELPAPKLAYAIQTGIIHGTSPKQTLPPHWHAGIHPSLIRLRDYTAIGNDLWNTSLDTEGFVVRFQGLKKTTAKRFLESELCMLMGCYSPIYSDGTIGLKRMTQVLENSASVIELNDRNVVSTDALVHDYDGMHNRLQIDWNWNGERFTRTTLFLDADSLETHGEAPLTKLQFRGLHGSRHTAAGINKRLESFRDRYTSPPERINVSVLSSLNPLEVGDVVRLKLKNIRDFAGEGPGINRAFEIQRKSADYVTGNVDLELFGSTSNTIPKAPNDTGEFYALPEPFYNGAGTSLAIVCTIVVVGEVGVIQPGTYNLPAGIYYYLGDLLLQAGALLTINGTVQIRTRGFFTVSGQINGVGRGKAGQGDSAYWDVSPPGLPGFLGNSRGMDGLYGRQTGDESSSASVVFTRPCSLTQGLNAAMPFFDLDVVGNDLLGVPADLAGTSGGAGGKLGKTGLYDGVDPIITSLGGDGANSGAGLVLINRGFAFSGSGAINLSGADSAATDLYPHGIDLGFATYPGPGGAGSPGGLLILLDGSSQVLPDLGGRFLAMCGTVPVSGTPLPVRVGYFDTLLEYGWNEPGSGYLDEAMISAVDLSNAAYRIQYIPQSEVAQEDQDQPATPTSITVRGGIGFIAVRVAVPNLDGNIVQCYASLTNDRADSLLVSEVQGNEFKIELPYGSSQYFWTRVRKRLTDGRSVYSGWLPESATGGVLGASRMTETDDIDPGSVISVVQTTPLTGNQNYGSLSVGFTWSDNRIIDGVIYFNDLDEVVTCEVSYKLQLALASAEISGIQRYAWLNVEVSGSPPIQAGENPDDGGGNYSNFVSPVRFNRSGSFTVDVPANGYVGASISTLLRAQAGVYPSIPDTEFSDASITIKGLQR